MILAVAVSGFVATIYIFHIGIGTSNCGPANPSSTAHFTIVESENGYNESKIHGLPWPIMNVTVGQTVIIHVINSDPAQAHGFAIIHYFQSGFTLRPGESHDLTFVACDLGSFQVFCTIFCTVHVPWMSNGKLNVNP